MGATRTIHGHICAITYCSDGHWECWVDGEQAGCAGTTSEAWEYIRNYIYWEFLYPEIERERRD